MPPIRPRPSARAPIARGPAARALTARLLTATLAALALGLAGTPSALADTGGPYAMHSMLQLNSPYQFKQAMFAAARAAGASEIRVDASLSALNNPWISTAMWQGLDEYMQLSQQYSLPVLLDFNASNDITLETCQPGIDPTQGICGVSNLTGYYDEVAAVVRHSAGVIDDFEVVNEPDGEWAFTGTPQQYAGMLATAYAAVHDNDPAGRVVLGGIMSPQDKAWLTDVFATPGYDAANKFDIANVHIRDSLASLASDVIGWRRYFTFFGGANLQLWVTETGYPSDPAYQYDPEFRGTDPTTALSEQAAFLANALPTLLSAGAARVFVTERDNLTGQFASEGLIGGQVTDADEQAPSPVFKPAYSAFALLAAGAAAAGPKTPPTLGVPVPPPPAPPAPSAGAPLTTATATATASETGSRSSAASPHRPGAPRSRHLHRHRRRKPRRARHHARRELPARNLGRRRA